jgi:hypothetical protein
MPPGHGTGGPRPSKLEYGTLATMPKAARRGETERRQYSTESAAYRFEERGALHEARRRAGKEAHGRRI